MNLSSEHWDALAPHHASLEDNYLNVPGLRHIMPEVRQRVLVVGAGQGLLVEELLRQGFQTDGIDLSPEMIRYAKSRRGVVVIQADARSLPFGAGACETVIYATGVIDFMGDEELIGAILSEGRRVISQSGKIFVAFYRMSAASEEFLTRLGLLKDNVLSVREALEIHRLSAVQTLSWVAKKANVSFFRAVIMALRARARSTPTERRMSFQARKVFRNREHLDALIKTAPESQPYRNEPEIRNLFKRLAIEVKKFKTTESCFIVQI